MAKNSKTGFEKFASAARNMYSQTPVIAKPGKGSVDKSETESAPVEQSLKVDENNNEKEQTVTNSVGKKEEVNTAPVVPDVVAEDKENKSAPGVSRKREVAAEKQNVRRGRPKQEGREELVQVNFLLNKQLKRRLEEARLASYKKTITEVIIEGIIEVCKKYGV